MRVYIAMLLRSVMDHVFLLHCIGRRLTEACIDSYRYVMEPMQRGKRLRAAYAN